MKHKDTLVQLTILPNEKAEDLQSTFSKIGVDVTFEAAPILAPFTTPTTIVQIPHTKVAVVRQFLHKYPDYVEKYHIDMTVLKNYSTILVPIDFSEYSKLACRFAFDMADTYKVSVTLLHAYFTPFLPSSFPDSDVYTTEINEEQLSQDLLKRVQEQSKDFTNLLNEKIKNQELPNIPFHFILKEGIPEEVINRWSRHKHPLITVMGTRGKDQKEIDLIGSVTAEVIDSSKVPVFAIPEDTRVKTMAEIKKLAYVTNFDDRDMLGFHKLMELDGFNDKEITFLYLKNKKKSEFEVDFAAVKSYLKKNYPELEPSFGVIDEDELLNNTDQFIKNNDIDVLVLTTHKRNIFARLFNPSIAHKVVFHADTPLLVIRS